MQLDAFEGENQPFWHGAQPDALNVPGFVTLPKKFGAHTLHATTDALPAAGVVTPGLHAVQAAAFAAE